MIHPTGAVARRFPLVARPRPACTPLPERVADLCTRAAHAAENCDPAAATAMFNLAALLASDCGRPDLARTWSHELARTALHHQQNPRHALEPIVNLARLHTRAGDGLTAWSLLETLYQAVASRTPVVIDGIHIPADTLTGTPHAHRDLRTWLWAVLLSSGAHALATAGRWDDAAQRLDQYNGIGHRMLDGRQIAVLAHATTGHPEQALTLLRDTEPGEPWEHAVTACLTLLCQPVPDRHIRRTAVEAYQALDPNTGGLAVFHTRLGLSVIDALGGEHQPETRPISATLITHAANDGYAARDVLSHPGCRSSATPDQRRHLTMLIHECGLNTDGMSEPLVSTLRTCLNAAASVLSP